MIWVKGFVRLENIPVLTFHKPCIAFFVFEMWLQAFIVEIDGKKLVCVFFQK